MSLSTKWVAILEIPTQLPMKYSDAELRNLVGRATPRHQRWENANTDRMIVVCRSSSTESQANRPRLDGDLVSAEDHVAEKCCGFTEVDRALLASRDLLRARRNGSYALFAADARRDPGHRGH